MRAPSTTCGCSAPGEHRWTSSAVRRSSVSGESMTIHPIAVIPGDGIGQEVVPAATRVLEAAGARSGFTLTWEHFPWGSDYYRRHGRMMPAGALDLLRGFAAILFGAVGDPTAARSHHARRPAAADPPRVRPIRLRAACGALSRRAQPARRQDAAATSTSSWCARTPKGSTRRSAASSTRAAPTRWRCRRPSSRGTASSA